MQALTLIAPADWTVIGLYAVGMLSVGWYYSRSNETADDYLLGGRNMRPWAVGLSLTVLILLLDWEESRTPILCSVLAVITIAYTSLGGLRADVVTDVVQTIILFGGALLTVILITVHFGGVAPWWPDP